MAAQSTGRSQIRLSPKTDCRSDHPRPGKGRDSPAGYDAHAAPLFCHPPGGGWDGPALHPGTSRAQEIEDHRDLHTRQQEGSGEDPESTGCASDQVELWNAWHLFSIPMWCLIFLRFRVEPGTKRESCL